MKNADKPARPATHNALFYGLTKREHIAAMILQGLVSNNGLTSKTTEPRDLSAKALLITDELLNQLEI